MSKIVITLNSHALSDFQQCEHRYLCSSLISLEPLVSKKAFDEGTLIHRWLRLFYYHKMRKFQGHVSVLRMKALVNASLWQSVAFKNGKIPGVRAFELFRALSKYSHEYKNENWKTIGTEVGFSIVLYEDDNYIFVYEGKIDWLGYSGAEKLVVDHKSRSGKYQIYEFNNQCIGYLLATGATKFVYNFITLTNIPTFERVAHSFTEAQIEDWKKDTIQWYFRVARSLESKQYLKSRQCSGKYGVCEFHSICETPKLEQQLFIVKSQFKVGNPHRSW